MLSFNFCSVMWSCYRRHTTGVHSEFPGSPRSHADIETESYSHQHSGESGTALPVWPRRNFLLEPSLEGAPVPNTWVRDWFKFQNTSQQPQRSWALQHTVRLQRELAGGARLGRTSVAPSVTQQTSDGRNACNKYYNNAENSRHSHQTLSQYQVFSTTTAGYILKNT